MPSLDYVHPIDAIDPIHGELSRHDSWRIALYYYYVDLDDVHAHVKFHQELCEKYDFHGRIRVSVEGINGVLSGIHAQLLEYEKAFRFELGRISTGTNNSIPFVRDANVRPCSHLDIKYCRLRPELPIESQLFDSLVVKATKSVISLFDHELQPSPPSSKSKSRSKQSNRRRRRKEQRHQEQQELHDCSNGQGSEQYLLPPTLPTDLLQADAALHLSAEEWNDKLMRQTEEGKQDSAIVLDIRNCYESRVGHFAVPNVPTMLTNTRKYSDLPAMLASHPDIQEKEEVFMYCTGGVRCERVSMMMRTLYPEKRFYQLKGGIQTYLKDTSQDDNLFLGKNFVFDPRRTDPTHFGSIVGKCIVCEKPHDDYDNGHAPNENREARCGICRMLILVCNTCRQNFQCFGEELGADRPLLRCGYPEQSCIHEGVAPKPELVQSKVTSNDR